MTTPGTGPAALPALSSASDDAGLICAYLFDGPDGDGAARAVDAAEAV